MRPSYPRAATLLLQKLRILRESSPRHLDLNSIHLSPRSSTPQVLVRRLRAQAEERASVLASEGARHRAPAGSGDSLQHPPGTVDPGERIFLEEAYPHASFTVHADPVGLSQPPEASAKEQGTIILDVEAHEAVAGALRDEQLLAVARDRQAVRKAQPLGDDSR